MIEMDFDWCLIFSLEWTLLIYHLINYTPLLPNTDISPNTDVIVKITSFGLRDCFHLFIITESRISFKKLHLAVFHLNGTEDAGKSMCLVYLCTPLVKK